MRFRFEDRVRSVTPSVEDVLRVADLAAHCDRCGAERRGAMLAVPEPTGAAAIASAAARLEIYGSPRMTQR
jgi:hypothetical protein